MYFRIFTCLVAFGFVVRAAPGDGVLATLPDGKLMGGELATDAQTSFYMFLGIPYAAPPIGDLRFAAPQPPVPWSVTRNSTYARSVCFQGSTPFRGAENCLFLNVYTSTLPNSNPSVKKPVMVWIHGGGFIFGSGDLGPHGADRFLDNGVIVVSLNYRLSAFGFLCTQDSSSYGNWGLKDQIAALRWVQNNIAIFGGDKDKVTIFGQSAGSSSVQYLLQSPLTTGLYHAAIAESGSTLNPWSLLRNGRQVAFTLGTLNGIFTSNSTELVRRLRRVSAMSLQKSSTVSQFLNTFNMWNGLPFAPCIEKNVEGAVVTSYSYELLKYGNFVQVPLISGFTSNEVRDATQLPWVVSLYSTKFNIFPESLVPADMNTVDKSPVVARIKQFYFCNQPIRNDPNFIHYASDNLFVRGIRKSAQLAGKFVPTYLYRFSFTGGALHNSFIPEGVSHAEELQFLFNVPQRTAEANRTVKRIIKMWTNFAKFKNPTPTLDPEIGAIWPVAVVPGNNDLKYLDIGTNLVPGVNPEQPEMDFWENLYTQFGLEPYNTY